MTTYQSPVSINNNLETNFNLYRDYIFSRGTYKSLVSSDAEFANRLKNNLPTSELITDKNQMNSYQVLFEIVEDLAYHHNASFQEIIDYLLENRDFNPTEIDEILDNLTN